MNPYQTLLLIFLSIRSILAYDYEIMYGVNEPLYEPERIDLSYSGAKLTLYVRLCKYSVTGKDAFLYIRMTRFCYCTSRYEDASCSYPGPTLILKGNTKITLTIVNQMSGEESTMDNTYWNHFKDLSTTNLHTHGLHVSPFEDDVLNSIEPGNKYKTPYTFGFHYPGTHWYHAHHHGSVTLQVDGGLAGGIIMTSSDPYEQELYKYKENVLLFNWQYPMPKSQCIPDSNRGGSSSNICPGLSSSNTDPLAQQRRMDIEIVEDSMCCIYCQMPTFQLDSADYIYDLQTDLKPINNKYPMLYFTNGQLHPIIDDLEIGVFRRLRLINSIGNFFIQFKFPDECYTFLIAMDGIYLDNEYMNFDLSKSSHLNELLVSPGARADVLIKCNSAGIYDIYSSENTQQDREQLPLLGRIEGGYKLFSIHVNNYNKKSDYAYVGTDILPRIYPIKPSGSYLQNLYDYKSTNTECNCHRPIPGDDFDPNSECFFEFGEDPNSVNGKPFDIRDSVAPLHIADTLSIIHYNSAYEFEIDNENGHVYHQHVNPFQYMEHVGQNGFIAFKNQWADNFGNDGRVQNVKIRMWTRDYWGVIVNHCHILEHEDTGMMGFFNILPDNTYICPFSSGNRNGVDGWNGGYNGQIQSSSSDERSNKRNKNAVQFGSSSSDSDSDSAEWNYEKIQNIDSSNKYAAQKSTLSEHLDVLIPISAAVIMFICGLVLIFSAIIYKKHKKQKRKMQIRVPTNENDYDDDDDDDIYIDENDEHIDENNDNENNDNENNGIESVLRNEGEKTDNK